MKRAVIWAGVLAAAAAPKSLVSVRGGHMDAFNIDKATYFGALGALVRTVTPATSASAAHPDGESVTTR